MIASDYIKLGQWFVDSRTDKVIKITKLTGTDFETEPNIAASSVSELRDLIESCTLAPVAESAEALASAVRKEQELPRMFTADFTSGMVDVCRASDAETVVSYDRRAGSFKWHTEDRVERAEALSLLVSEDIVPASELLRRLEAVRALAVRASTSPGHRLSLAGEILAAVDP